MSEQGHLTPSAGQATVRMVILHFTGDISLVKGTGTSNHQQPPEAPGGLPINLAAQAAA